MNSAYAKLTESSVRIQPWELLTFKPPADCWNDSKRVIMHYVVVHFAAARSHLCSVFLGTIVNWTRDFISKHQPFLMLSNGPTHATFYLSMQFWSCNTSLTNLFRFVVIYKDRHIVAYFILIFSTNFIKKYLL